MSLHHAWYAVALEQEVGPQPAPVNIDGLPLVVFRMGSKIHVWGAHCPHRGCHFQLGEVEGSTLQCAYHGWKFDERGQCVHVPANESTQFVPKGARTLVYPVLVQAGIVWVFPKAMISSADAANISVEVAEPGLEPPQSRKSNQGLSIPVPPLSVFSELMDDAYQGPSLRVVWNAHITRAVESVLDVSHLPFVHPSSTGEDVSPVVQDLWFHAYPNGLSIEPSVFAPRHPMQPSTPILNHGKRTQIAFLYPNHWAIRTPVGDGMHMFTYLTFTPLSDHETLIIGRVMRDFAQGLEFLDEHHLEHTLRVMQEDRQIVEMLSPAVSPRSQSESHVPSDVPGLHYREWYYKSQNHLA